METERERDERRINRLMIRDNLRVTVGDRERQRVRERQRERQRLRDGSID